MTAENYALGVARKAFFPCIAPHGRQLLLEYVVHVKHATCYAYHVYESAREHSVYALKL